MRTAATIAALLGSVAVAYGGIFAAFLVGGFTEGSRLIGYLWTATLVMGVASAAIVWWRPKAAAALLGLAAAGWVTFFLMSVAWAPARANDVPGARLNPLALLVALAPTIVLLLGAFFAARAKGRLVQPITPAR